MPFCGPLGERIAYSVQGSGPALVLLHGFTASSATFTPNVPELARRFTVVTVDLLGHGASDAPEDSDAYSIDASVGRLTALLDELRIQEALLCGHALGGALAMRFAVEQPERCAGLVVVNSTAAIAGEGWREAARPGIASFAARVRAEGVDWLAGSRMNPARAAAIPADTRARLEAAFLALTPHAVAATAERLAVELNAPELLPAVQAPTLLVIGERDQDVVRQVDGFLSRAPAGLVTTAMLPGAGHAANLEDPRGFRDALVGFAESIGYVVAPQSRLGVGNALVGAGATLVVGGFVMLGAALFFRPGDSTPAAAPPDGPTQVAGERADTGPTPSSQPAIATVRTPTQAASPSAEAMTTGTATAEPAESGEDDPADDEPTTEPSDTPEPAATPEPTQPPPTPTSEPTSIPPATIPPSPTQSGPFAAISGPSQADPGVSVTFENASDGNGARVLRQDWTIMGVTADYGPSATVTFPAAGCYPVSVVTYFAGGVVDTASITVSVGGAACQ